MAPTLNVIIPGSGCFVLGHEYLSLTPKSGRNCRRENRAK
jgi:hypothetical protein